MTRKLKITLVLLGAAIVLLPTESTARRVSDVSPAGPRPSVLRLIGTSPKLTTVDLGQPGKSAGDLYVLGQS
jgi:hypothetical protein